METIGSLWWIWLIGTIACYAIAFGNQLRRIGTLDLDTDDLFSGFTKGLTTLFLFSICGIGFFIILLISIIVNIIQWVIS